MIFRIFFLPLHAQIYLKVMENTDFLIPLNGLASGKTVYRWTAGREFFEEFGNSDILDADLKVEAEVEKSGHYIGIDCHIYGSLTVECDRCLCDLAVPVDTLGKFSVKFGSGDGAASAAEEDGREIVFLPEADTDLDLGQIIYDYACLSLPVQRVHEEGGCDPEVIRHLGYQGSQNDGQGEENPFSALKDMFRS